MFGKLLDEAQLLYDDLGQKRTLYSCRHTYATFQLLYGNIDVYTLAIMMGTSVPMIERFYSHVKPRLAADKTARIKEEKPEPSPIVRAKADDRTPLSPRRGRTG